MNVKALEISSTDHCNLRCAQCNHASPHLAPRFTPIATIVRDLSVLRGVVRADELRIAGGEPLQHPELVPLARAVRELDLAGRLVLISNGVLLHRCSWAFLETVDELQISRYPGVRVKCDLRELEEACRRHGVVLRVRDMRRFSRTMLTRRNDNRVLVNFIYRHCALVNQWSCHLVYEGRLYKCTTSAFMGARLAKAGIGFDSTADGVDLHGGGHLERRIHDYMASKRPLAACEYCLGTLGRQVRSHQLSRKGLDRELEDDHVQAVRVLGLRGAAESLLMPRLHQLSGRRRVRRMGDEG